MELLLLKVLLDAITSFLDQEEKLGFLEQDVVDKILAVERMIDEVIFGMTHKNDEISSQSSQPQELMYVPFLDEDDVEYTHKTHHEMEI